MCRTRVLSQPAPQFPRVAPGNTNFPNLPVTPADLKTNVDSLSALIAEAADGSKKAIAQKKKQREVVIKMLRLNVMSR